MWKRSILLTFAALGGILAAAQPGVSQVVYSSAELTDPPRLASPTQAQTEIQQSAQPLLERGVSGKVQLRFVVKSDGKVDPKSVEVVAATTEALRSFAVNVIKKIQFVPGKKDGTAVASQVILPLSIGG